MLLSSLRQIGVPRRSPASSSSARPRWSSAWCTSCARHIRNGVTCCLASSRCLPTCARCPSCTGNRRKKSAWSGRPTSSFRRCSTRYSPITDLMIRSPGWASVVLKSESLRGRAVSVVGQSHYFSRVRIRAKSESCIVPYDLSGLVYRFAQNWLYDEKLILWCI